MSMSAATLGINMEETVFVKFPGADHAETFMYDRVTNCDLIKMMLLPCCCLIVPWVSKTRQMKYALECTCCSGNWTVLINDALVGRTRMAACCENGCLFEVCPCLTCGGKLKMIAMEDGNHNEQFLLARNLFPCWPAVTACATVCVPLGTLCVSIDGCCKYCNGQQIKTITQPVYKGPWTRTSGVDPEKIGEFVITQRFNPIGLCCAAPTPMKYFFRPTSADGTKLSADAMSGLSMVLQLYRGMPSPCKVFSSGGGLQIPAGVPCADVGLDTEVSWMTVPEVMAMSS